MFFSRSQLAERPSLNPGSPPSSSTKRNDDSVVETVLGDDLTGFFLDRLGRHPGLGAEVSLDGDLGGQYDALARFQQVGAAVNDEQVRQLDLDHGVAQGEAGQRGVSGVEDLEADGDVVALDEGLVARVWAALAVVVMAEIAAHGEVHVRLDVVLGEGEGDRCQRHLVLDGAQLPAQRLESRLAVEQLALQLGDGHDIVCLGEERLEAGDAGLGGGYAALEVDDPLGHVVCRDVLGA